MAKTTIDFKIDWDPRQVEGDVEEAILKSYYQEVTLAVYNAVQHLTPVDFGHAQRGWKIDREGGEVWNNVAYILRLEYGHSKQNPFGMVRTTLLALDTGGIPAVNNLLNFKLNKK